jgi:hypothetical protein
MIVYSCHYSCHRLSSGISLVQCSCCDGTLKCSPQHYPLFTEVCRRTFDDRTTSVETWIDSLPYTLPLEVIAVDGEFLSLDNRRLYSTKNFSPNDTANWVVHQLNDPPTELMKDYSLDLLEMIWVDVTSTDIARCHS